MKQTVSQTVPEHATTCGPDAYGWRDLHIFSGAFEHDATTCEICLHPTPTTVSTYLTCRMPALRGIYDHAAPRVRRAERRIGIVKRRTAQITERDSKSAKHGAGSLDFALVTP
jgi:hypothetical protein